MHRARSWQLNSVKVDIRGKEMSSHDDSHPDHPHEDEQPRGHDHPHKEDAHKQDDHEHGLPGHDHGGGAHGHVHGTIDPSITASDRGLWAVKWSFVGLFITT